MTQEIIISTWGSDEDCRALHQNEVKDGICPCCDYHDNSYDMWSRHVVGFRKTSHHFPSLAGILFLKCPECDEKVYLKLEKNWVSYWIDRGVWS